MVCVSLLVLGCRRGHPERQAVPLKAYTEDQLKEYIHVGMDVSNVISQFGNPQATASINSNETLESYVFSSDSAGQKSGLHVDGFSIYVEQGKVIYWSPDYTRTYTMFQHNGKPQTVASYGQHTFELFVERDSLTNVLEMLNLNGHANAASITAPPDMTFKASVYADEATNSVNQPLFLTISEKDVSKLSDLTKHNFGKRILVVCQGVVIAAPTIEAQINTHRFEFPTRDSEFLSHLK